MKFLIAGLGSIGQRHLRNLISLGEKDIILYRTNKGALENKEFTHIPIVSDLRSAFDQKPDAVIISNPTSLHLDVAIPAADAGCAILIEKPLSNSMDNIDKLKMAAKNNSARILVGFQFRFHSNLRKIANLLNEKKVGEPVFVRAHYGEYLPAWHPWEDYRQSYSARADLGGGVIFTLCHPLDYLRWLIGEVQDLWAFIGHRGGLNLNVEDSAEIGLRFANGVIGSVHLSYIQRPPAHFLEIICTEGVIHWDYFQDVIIVSRSEGSESIPSSYTDIRNPMFLEEMRHFQAIVYGEEQPLCTLDDGIRALELALAAHESANSSKIMSW
jgi:predicted dehydrogenase